MTPRIAIACLLMALCFGCGTDYIDGSYGRQRLPGTAGSVNGTDVLAAMFEDAGHEVYTRRTLVTGELDAADVVVWFPNDISAPREEVCDWFDEWLAESPGRTLIFVGRDFDAEPQYWEFHYNRKPGEAPKKEDLDAPFFEDEAAESDSKKDAKNDAEKAAAKREEKDAKDGSPTVEPPTDSEDQAEGDEDDDAGTGSPNCLWFTYDEGEKTTVRELTGPWAEGIDAAQARIEVETRLVPKGDYEVLLDSETGPLVSRLVPPYSEGSQIILVENGSFLLNLPMINHEHRMLAGELVAAVGDSGSVVFLESGPGGPPIDPPPTDSSLWTLFQGWPLGAILLQLGIAGIVFCFVRWPIFGRPKEPPGIPMSDFSHHVAAVGELLVKTRDPKIASPPESPPAVGRPAAVPQRGSSSLFR